MHDETNAVGWPFAAGALAILFLFFAMVMALAADMKVPPKAQDEPVKAWICGYSSGFEDGIRKLDDPRQPENDQCAKYRARAKSVLK